MLKTDVKLLNLILVLVILSLTYKTLQLRPLRNHAGSQVVTAEEISERSHPLLHLSLPAEPASHPSSHYQVIAQKNLFHPDRTFPVAPTSASTILDSVKSEPTRKSTPTPPTNPPDILLYGTVTGVENYILAREKSAEEPRKYNLGDEIGGYLVKDILRKKVMVAKDGQEFEVLLGNEDSGKNDFPIEKGLADRKEMMPFPSPKVHVPEGLPGEAPVNPVRSHAYALGTNIPLSHSLMDYDVRAREKAVLALGMRRDQRALPLLIQTLQDENEYVRGRAATALGMIGAEEAVEALARALREDEHGDVRMRAADALGTIGSSRAIEPLLNALQDEYFETRQAAVDALAAIGGRGLIGPLERVALQDKDEEVRQAAEEALQELRKKGFFY